MAALNEYRNKFRLLTKQKVIAERMELFESINGNAFFPFKVMTTRIPKDVLRGTQRWNLSKCVRSV